MDHVNLYSAFRQALCAVDGLSDGARILVAVSGGADSMALLHLSVEVAAERGYEVCAAHFDHGLRDDSAADAEFVARHCAELGVRLVTDRCDVGDRARELGVGLEEAGRALRYAFFERCAAELGCERVLLGHHCQDQAETVLHRLVRGTGFAGLAAMRVSRGLFVRPLLFCPREVLRDYLVSRGIDFREDPTNADVKFTRNFIRHRVLPTLRQLNPRLDESLLHLAEVAANEEDFWSARVAELCACLQHPRGGWSVPGLLGLHVAELRRVLLHLLRGAMNGQVGYVHVSAVEKLLRGAAPQAEISLPGGRAVRRFERLELQAAGADPVQPWTLKIEGLGRYDLPGGAQLVLEEAWGEARESRWSVVFPRAVLSFPLLLRPFRAGDRIALADGMGHKKLKKLYGEKRLEQEVRMQLPLLIMGNEVLWIPGLRRSGAWHYEPEVDQGVRITMEKPESIESLLVKSGCLC